MTSLISWALISFKIFALNYRSLWNTIFLDGTAELKLRSYAVPLSSVSIVPSAPSRGPLGFFLAPNIALKGLFVVWAFLQASAHSGHHPPEIIFIKLHHSSLFRFKSFTSCACPFPTRVHLIAPKQSHEVVWSIPLSFIIRILCNCVVIILFLENLSFIF